MLSQRVSGNRSESEIIQLARIINANPWIKISSIIGISKKHSRSAVEREVIKLVESIGISRQFTLTEIIELLTTKESQYSNFQRLLISPADFLDHLPLEQKVSSIPSYLEEILRKAQHEVLLLTPFWDISTIKDLLRCIPQESVNIELVLLLVHTGKRIPRIEKMVNEIRYVLSPHHIRIYFHIRNQGEKIDYPHAKCLVVDRRYGYLGSANFTSCGMKGHFEVGVSLGAEESRTLGGILQYLWAQSGLFNLAWDSVDIKSFNTKR